ncbi:MAG: DNA polymerase IV [Bacteroidetes bacterium]|nr:DNA polymerase IV [Bacteroidota bacterium]
MQVQQNHIKKDLTPNIMFVDMNSFFATCEQQVNFYLRNRPVAVCVYTGKYGCVIAPSIEAKKKGIKLGVRLNEAMKICPELIPLETHPNRYREFHKQIMKVLKKYSEEVIPKSIDEAVINFSSYKLVHKDLVQVAKQIKEDIRNEVGDYMKCSIGIAPNAFLAKLGSDIQKPDGLTVISPDNIDEVLSKLTLTDLPGIAKAMAMKLKLAGIHTPLQLRHMPVEKLKTACNSIVGIYWHYRLNFSEVDFSTHDYKSMQAMRQISASQRKNVKMLDDLLVSLCTTLEKRMVKQEVYAKDVMFTARYENGVYYKESFNCDKNPVQDAMKMVLLIKNRMEHFQKANHCEPVINTQMSMMGVNVFNFIPDCALQYDMFENNVQQHHLRKTMYDIKNKFGNDSIQKAAELHEVEVYKDAIGFGSVKHLY